MSGSPIETFDFMESRLLGVALNDNNSEVKLSFVDTSARSFSIKLKGIDRLRVDGFREQNVIENFAYWANGQSAGLREAVFDLISGRKELECSSEQRAIAESLVSAICNGEVAMLSLTAIYGAEVLATFQSMELAFT
jgi:hypothetical protein